MVNYYLTILVFGQSPPKSPVGQGRKRKLDTGKMTALRNAGWSYEKIADEMGCSAGTVWNYFNKEGG